MEYEMCPPETMAYFQEKAELLPAFKRPILMYLWSGYSICLSISFPTIIERLLQETAPGTNKPGLWMKLSEAPKVKEALVISQRAALISFLDAYENFLCLTLKIAIRLQNIEVKKGADFFVVFESCFGEEALEQCWTNDEILTFVKVREALVCHGGRVSPHLESLLRGSSLLRNQSLEIRRPDNEYLWTVLGRGSSFLIDVLSNNYDKMINNYEGDKLPFDL